MTIPSAHFEAKKHAYRQTQDGVVISFVVHPNDLNAALAVAPLGTRYMVAVAEIGDDEQPISSGAPVVGSAKGTNTEQGSLGSADGSQAAPRAIASDPAPVESKERRRFSDLPLPQQVALRCNDPNFQRFAWKAAGEWGALFTEKDTAEWVREACDVRSRADIKPGTTAGKRWLALEIDFLASTHQMAEAR